MKSLRLIPDNLSELFTRQLLVDAGTVTTRLPIELLFMKEGTVISQVMILMSLWECMIVILSKHIN